MSDDLFGANPGMCEANNEYIVTAVIHTSERQGKIVNMGQTSYNILVTCPAPHPGQAAQ